MVYYYNGILEEHDGYCSGSELLSNSTVDVFYIGIPDKDHNIGQIDIEKNKDVLQKYITFTLGCISGGSGFCNSYNERTLVKAEITYSNKLTYHPYDNIQY